MTPQLPEPPAAAYGSSRSQLEEAGYIRAQLFSGERSLVRRYADLVVGSEAGMAELARYELITMLFGRVSGALGLALRKIAYPGLFAACGRGVVFGRDLTLRNTRRISLGDNVVLDDGCVIDGRGAGEEGVRIGARTILGRDVSIQAKIGPVHIGQDCDIGMSTVLHAQGGLLIGDAVVMGGGCKVSGGAFQIGLDDATGSTGEQAARGQTRWTSGPIRIGHRCLIGMGTIILDGVEIGDGAVIGAGSLLNRSIPANAVAAGSPARVLRMRDAKGG